MTYVMEPKESSLGEMFFTDDFTKSVATSNSLHPCSAGTEGPPSEAKSARRKRLQASGSGARRARRDWQCRCSCARGCTCHTHPPAHTPAHPLAIVLSLHFSVSVVFPEHVLHTALCSSTSCFSWYEPLGCSLSPYCAFKLTWPALQTHSFLY